MEQRRLGKLPPLPKSSVEDRFWPKVDKTSSPKGCWLWTAGRCQKGYGTFRNGKMQKAHRYSYELLVGPIPPELPFLDHMCYNTSCVNPDHLRPVTNQQNLENSPKGYKDFLGVTYHRGTGKYMAKASSGGVRYYLGLFVEKEDAALAARDKRNELMTHNDSDRR